VARWPTGSEQQRTTFGGLSRSALMSRVRSSGNLTTEVRLVTLLRRAKLAGWRRHHALFGRPDFVWPKQRLVIFADGCFWHGHECGKNIRPRTNSSAWEAKIKKNRERDRSVTRRLRDGGWRVLRIWECMLRKKPQLCIERIRHELMHKDPPSLPPHRGMSAK
jgi:DNA mismatch endonuclease (patch repair protein)